MTSSLAPCCLLLALLAGCPAPADDDDSTPDDSEQTSDPYGPENAWYHADVSDVPAAASDAGWGLGQQVPDLHLIDQNGDEV